MFYLMEVLLFVVVSIPVLVSAARSDRGKFSGRHIGHDYYFRSSYNLLSICQMH